jgi:hypothetical protein
MVKSLNRIARIRAVERRNAHEPTSPRTVHRSGGARRRFAFRYRILGGRITLT